jgi:2-dehydropantoate 2-reductase
MKSQDTPAALGALVDVAPTETAIVCAQNGVANELHALRWFPNVYGMCVVCAAAYLSPGRVIAHTAPKTGIFDLGRYPRGIDATATAIAAAFTNATLETEVREEVMRWKYAKLLRNLSTVLQALCGPDVGAPEVTAALRAEAIECFAAAGDVMLPTDEWVGERTSIVRFSPVEGFGAVAGSTWQSFVRGTGSIETDYLNGEVVLLGRLYGVPTPVNQAVTAIARDLAHRHAPAGSMSEAELLAACGLVGS